MPLILKYAVFGLVEAH